eukprot:scaffold4144_cov32-Attheya_sp.AAC.1
MRHNDCLLHHHAPCIHHYTLLWTSHIVERGESQHVGSTLSTIGGSLYYNISLSTLERLAYDSIVQMGPLAGVKLAHPRSWYILDRSFLQMINCVFLTQLFILGTPLFVLPVSGVRQTKKRTFIT